MYTVLGVARSGYDTWRQRGGKPSPRRRQQAITDQRLAEAFKHGKERSGAPRLTHDLNDAGIAICRNTVAASLLRQNLRAKAARQYQATTNSRHGLPVAPNLLLQDFTAGAPNQKWVGDITYLATGEVHNMIDSMGAFSQAVHCQKKSDRPGTSAPRHVCGAYQS
ncbi:hypothetical protein BCL93_10964 [Onishia taeanensis]|uniref:HTH-like domain-containing protein n=1 Tax=Onishia taeanensis TaxID=284577 RepID=A0A328XTI4_9GAMM|nr:hypothetical protein BCL93_10964 [Halomonas taeanensis]